MATDFMKGMQLESEAWGSMIFRCQHLPIEENPFSSSLLKGKHILKKKYISDFYPTSIQHLPKISCLNPNF